MRRITKENINTPEFFDNHFSGVLQYADIDRLEKLAKYYNGGNYLEVGCFDSPLPIILSERYPDSIIMAMDFSPKVIETLAPLYPRVSYFVGDARNFMVPDVDYIVAGEVIEHMEYPKDFIIQCLGSLKRGGTLAISTPLEESDRREVGGKQHLWSFTEQDFKDWDFETEIMDKTILAWRKLG